MERWTNQVAVITGASSGIGAAIAIQLVELGLKVVGLARRKERLEELGKKFEHSKGNFYYVVTDVSKEDDIVAAFDWIKRNVGPVSILVNNAGILRLSSLIDGISEDINDTFNTNVLGLVIATREAVKNMKDNKIAGHVIHMNSICGHTVVRQKNQNVYAASKYAVTALTEILRNELSFGDSKIKVTSISPGVVKTEIIPVALEKIGFKLEDVEDSIVELESEDVADAVIYVLSTPPHVQIHELIIKPVGEPF